MTTENPQRDSRWPHRFAVLLACATFPLIWVGGLVTTYRAGMAVPDWPNTYGYNLFLYPWQSWIAGPFDLFIEHGHRLLGALVGLLTIAVTVAVFLADSRSWVKRFALVALAAVIGQGCLGGARVLLDERLLALTHGCVAPLFFAMAVALCVFSSGWWKESWDARHSEAIGTLRRIAALTAAVVYIQLVLGAVLRHMPVWASPGTFRIAVFFHLLFAAVVTGHIVLLIWRTRHRSSAPLAVRWPVWGLLILLVCQLSMGCASWVVTYWFPGWAADWGLAAVQYTTVEARGLTQSLIVTAHQATGSLILGLAVFLTLRVSRLCPRTVVKLGANPMRFIGVLA